MKKLSKSEGKSVTNQVRQNVTETWALSFIPWVNMPRLKNILKKQSRFMNKLAPESKRPYVI